MAFEEALARFRARLREAGWPERILWTRPRDVGRDADGSVLVYLTTDAEDTTERARDYDDARGAVTLTAVCTLGDATCATLTSSNATLTFVVAAAPAPGAARWPVC